jgi:hypothetical protein
VLNLTSEISAEDIKELINDINESTILEYIDRMEEELIANGELTAAQSLAKLISILPAAVESGEISAKLEKIILATRSTDGEILYSYTGEVACTTE